MPLDDVAGVRDRRVVLDDGLRWLLEGVVRVSAKGDSERIDGEQQYELSFDGESAQFTRSRVPSTEFAGEGDAWMWSWV
jgi:hypothetical protein